MRCAIVLFGNDLRVHDNPALYHASRDYDCVIPLYVNYSTHEGDWQRGEASRWWLHHSIQHLQEQLQKRGAPLVIRNTPLIPTLENLLKQHPFHAIYYNVRYDPWFGKLEKSLLSFCSNNSLSAESFNGGLLHDPSRVFNLSNKPYRVYTHFLKKLDPLVHQHTVVATPKLKPFPATIRSDDLSKLELLAQPNWHDKLLQHWKPGETTALARWKRWLDGQFDNYTNERDVPAVGGTSGMSPYLCSGCISPRRMMNDIRAAMNILDEQSREDLRTYSKELVWREFSHYLLHHFPHMTDKPLNEKYNAFPYQKKYLRLLRKWQQGKTGVPLIDAGMRELWETGYMHNRVRMVVASYLTKNCLVHWIHGARWFWDTLVDADLAQNSFNWQWVAGCGADAAPYFRIFNPLTQAQKFDPDASYIKRWVPELSGLDAKTIHQLGDPLRNDEAKKYGYAGAEIDLKQSRVAALERHKQI